MKVYGFPGSTCTRKVLMTLHEKNCPYAFIPVDLGKGEHKQPEHLARQPFGVVPVLDHDGFVLYESRAIIRYLDAALVGEKLTPTDLKCQLALNFDPLKVLKIDPLFYIKRPDYSVSHFYF